MLKMADFLNAEAPLMQSEELVMQSEELAGDAG